MRKPASYSQPTLFLNASGKLQILQDRFHHRTSWHSVKMSGRRVFSTSLNSDAQESQVRPIPNTPIKHPVRTK